MKRNAVVMALAVLMGVLPAAAQDWAECATLPDNLVAGLNCDFNDALNHWTFDSLMGNWTINEATGYPSAPSASAEALDPGSYAFTITSECLSVSSSTAYAIGLYSRTPGGATIVCAGRIEEFVTPDCSGGAATSPDAPFVPVVNVWSPWSVVWMMGPATGSARGVVECSADASFTVLFDNIAFVEGTVVPVELERLSIE